MYCREAWKHKCRTCLRFIKTEESFSRQPSDLKRHVAALVSCRSDVHVLWSIFLEWNLKHCTDLDSTAPISSSYFKNHRQHTLNTSCYEATVEEEYYPSLHDFEHPKYIKLIGIHNIRWTTGLILHGSSYILILWLTGFRFFNGHTHIKRLNFY